MAWCGRAALGASSQTLDSSGSLEPGMGRVKAGPCEWMSTICLTVILTIPVGPTVKRLSAILPLSSTLRFLTFSM